MSVLGVIPARYGSVRLPAKPLKNILGRPLLSWVIEGVQSSEKIDQFVVATDHADIAALAEKCGMEAVMTSPDHPSGSDRVWEVAAQKDCDIVLNIQGDEPLVSGALLDELACSCPSPHKLGWHHDEIPYRDGLSKDTSGDEGLRDCND